MRRMLGIVATVAGIATLLAFLTLSGGTPRTAAQDTGRAGDTDAAIAAALAGATAPDSGGVRSGTGQLSLSSMANAVVASGILSITSVTASYATASTGTPPVPCYSCVTTTPPPLPNSSEGLPIPLAALMHGASGEYTVQYQDLTYTGPCTIIFALLQGTTVIQSGHTSPINCAANSVGYGFFWATVPAKPGAAKVVGLVTFGTQKATGVQALTIQ